MSLSKKEMQAANFVKVGRSTPGGPGDIYVTETLMATISDQKLRELVRATYRAAYRR